MRKELAAVLVFESHAKAGTVCECHSFTDISQFQNCEKHFCCVSAAQKPAASLLSTSCPLWSYAQMLFEFFRLLKCLCPFCQIFNVEVNAYYREVVWNHNYCGCSVWKWCGWSMLSFFIWFLLWCSVQSGRQGHLLVHHLERLCKCDHTWEGKSRHRRLKPKHKIIFKTEMRCKAKVLCSHRALLLLSMKAKTLGSWLC